MVSLVQELEEDIIESSCYDEEIILEGLGIDSFRIRQSLAPSTLEEIPLMPMKMMITSIEDVDNDST